jgi:amidohydrolase
MVAGTGESGVGQAAAGRIDGGTGAREAAARTVQTAAEGLVALSHAVHADAELAFEEHRSSARVADALARAGLTVETGVAGLETAFVATAGSGPLTVAICAEYDALPGIGHACGHNVIAAAAVGAGLALAPLADELGLTVKVIGTPAEEGGGGKILMLDAGVFDGVHAAMMVHPAPDESLTLPCLAVEHLTVRYRGREAHASGYPELGINAADALTVAQVSIGLLRQHLEPSHRVHGIVTHGGDAPNIVPGATQGSWYVRAATLAALEKLSPRIHACFEAGALATGCELEVELASPRYSEFLPDQLLLDFYEREASAIGRVFSARETSSLLSGSTDMANVSLHVPTIHPMLGIDADGAVNHQPGFTAAAARPSADRAVLDGALAMARTAIAVALDQDARARLLATARG